MSLPNYEANEFEIRAALKKYFGYSSFRDGQQEVIESLMSGRDTLVVMPTGSGKSLCYQLPALISEGMALVVSPLIALMKDQVDALKNLGLMATYINSSLDYDEECTRIEKAKQGFYKLLYIAPERLENRKFLDTLPEMNISFIAIDEAHCISHWGHDFRPSYMNIVKIFDMVKKLPAIALTATATPDVQEDIVKSLKLNNAKRIVSGFDRPNLSYLSVKTNDKLPVLLERLNESHSGSSIIYCGTRKMVEEYSLELNASGIKALSYHAGMRDDERKKSQDAFLNQENSIIVATNAFGMGIDKPNVRNVIHLSLTQSLESYYQESGRAGRDGEPAVCLIIYDRADIGLMQFFIKMSYPEKTELEKVYNALYDINQVGMGVKSSAQILLDEYQIGNMVGMPAGAVKSSLAHFERNKIFVRQQNNTQLTLQFLVPIERLREFYKNIAPHRKKILEALIRNVGASSIEMQTSIDINRLLSQNKIDYLDLHQTLQSFALAGILNFTGANAPKGITALLPRQSFANIPFDYSEFYRRKQNAYERLDMMWEFVETDACKRNFILSYFEEKTYSEPCGRCSSCLNKSKKKPLPPKVNDDRLQNILEAAYFLNGHFGVEMLVDLLYGSKSQRLSKFNLEKSPVYGRCAGLKKTIIRDMVNEAISNGLLERDHLKYNVVSITEAGRRLLKVEPKEKFRFSSESNVDSMTDNALYRRLLDMRAHLARLYSFAEHAIVSDKTLREISNTKPQKKEDLYSISGASDAFVARFGDFFINVINEMPVENKVFTQTLPVDRSDYLHVLLNLFESGCSIDDIAVQVGQTKGNVARVIEEGILMGTVKDFNHLAKPELLAKLKPIVQKMPYRRLNDIKEALGEDVDFAELRIAVAIVKKKLQ